MNQSVANDLQIDRDVCEELVREARGRVRDVAVSVREGIVELSGVAASWGEHEDAEQAAHRVAGVLNVANHITVRLSAESERSDTELTQAVQRALEWDARLLPAQVHATVSRGVVTLAGKVDFSNQSDDASRCVRDLVGVRELRNLLHVAGTTPPVSGHAVRAAIDLALSLHTSRAAQHVEIDVYRGKVTLTGQVPSGIERAVIEGAARGTPGVETIDSRIRIL